MGTTHIQPEILATSTDAAKAWWAGLNEDWKRAFNEVALKRNSTEPLPDETLILVYNSAAHRFAGPRAPYPNMSFELNDMSGLVGLPNTEILVVSFHQLTHIREVAEMPKLKSLFVFSNEIQSLEGIDDLVDLIEVYAMDNQISSLLPLKNLVNLKRIYCSQNQIENLDGIGLQHTDNLETFICLPNTNLKPNTIFAFEQATQIRCGKA